MISHKYGEYSSTQLQEAILTLRKSIFFLLLYVDPKTRDEHPNVDVNKAFRDIQYKLGGLNSLLLEPPELVITMSLLESAWSLYGSADFDFMVYRKLILDAGSEIMRVKVGG